MLRKKMTIFISGGSGRCPRQPEEDNGESQKFDRKSFLNCRDRRPRLSGYANGYRYATTCNLNHSRRCILYRYDIGQSRTPVPTIKKKYSIEILEFAVISLGSSRTSTPTIDKDRRRMCGGDRYDLGRPVVAPTIKKECRRMCIL